MHLFPTQTPKASETSVPGCKDPTVAAQAVSAKGFQASPEEDLRNCFRACLHFVFHEQRSTGVAVASLLHFGKREILGSKNHSAAQLFIFCVERKMAHLLL